SEFLLQGSVGRLGVGKIAGLQSLADLGEKLFERILRAGGSVRAGGGMMVVVMRVARGGGRLEILLDSGVVLLGSGEVAGFEVGSQLAEGRSEAVRERGRRKG